MRIKLAYPLSLSEIAVATNGRITPPRLNRTVCYVSTDSRETFKGDLFIALKGENYDGEEFVSDILKKGAFHLSKSEAPNGICISDVGEGLLALAKYYKTKFTCLKYTVGITGSVGKTTTKEFLKVTLSEKYSTHATYKNLNNNIGVPLTLLSMPKGTEALVVEMGMNSFGEISKSSKCVSPNISLILNVGTSHIGLLGSRENIAKAKLEILDGMKNGVLLIPFGEPLLQRENTLTFSRANANATFRLDQTDGLHFYAHGHRFASLNFKFCDSHFLECLAATAACGHVAELSRRELCDGISKISDKNIRQKIISVEDFYFLTDFYNSSPESVLAALDSLISLSSYQRKSVLLGDILELGDKSEDIHRELGKTLAKYNLSNLYLFGKYSKNIFDGAVDFGFPKKRIFINEDTESPEVTARQIKDNHTRGEIILMKASRGIRLERILEFFEENQ